MKLMLSDSASSGCGEDKWDKVLWTTLRLSHLVYCSIIDASGPCRLSVWVFLSWVYFHSPACTHGREEHSQTFCCHIRNDKPRDPLRLCYSLCLSHRIRSNSHTFKMLRWSNRLNPWRKMCWPRSVVRNKSGMVVTTVHVREMLSLKWPASICCRGPAAVHPRVSPSGVQPMQMR